MSLRHDDERTFRTQVVAAALLDDPHRPQRLIAAQRAYPCLLYTSPSPRDS